jgi:alkylation response protein AidB-like acyl-CoA dehydrogenase
VAEVVAESFRAELRAWLAAAPRPPGLRDYGPTPAPEDVAPGRRWQRTLADAGYACLHWPRRYGGRDATVAEQAAFAEEAARAGLPRQLSIVGPDLAGPVLIRFGSQAQRDRHLERIRLGDDLWCQLFSEPDAGSDLAAVRTTARRADDGGWIVDGQKVWTSAGASADFGLLLARTGPPEAGRAGLTALIAPMRSAGAPTPGITVRPLRQMDGEAKFSEVFLDGVALPADAVLGAEGQGWAVATATLGRERLSLGANAVGLFRWLDDLVAAGGHLDAPRRHALVAAWIRVWLLRATWLRAVGTSGADVSSPAFSVLKLMSSTVQRDIADLGLDVLGLALVAGPRDADPGNAEFARRLLVGPAQTILGGTSEIQRNILAERVLGLPRGA